MFTNWREKNTKIIVDPFSTFLMLLLNFMKPEGSSLKSVLDGHFHHYLFFIYITCCMRVLCVDLFIFINVYLLIYFSECSLLQIGHLFKYSFYYVIEFRFQNSDRVYVSAGFQNLGQICQIPKQSRCSFSELFINFRLLKFLNGISKLFILTQTINSEMWSYDVVCLFSVLSQRKLFTWERQLVWCNFLFLACLLFIKVIHHCTKWLIFISFPCNLTSSFGKFIKDFKQYTYMFAF